MSNNIEVVSNAYVNDKGELILEMSSGNEINAGLVARPKPEVTESYVENNKVMLKFNDGTVREAFDVSELGYKDVREVYLDGYDVYAEYLDGEVKLLGNVFLETNSEIYTTYMNRDDGYMYGIRYNGEIETIGDLERYVGDRFSESIEEISSNDLDEVILHTTDNKEYNIGKIYFKDYKRDDESLREITNVWVDRNTGMLKVTYSDGVTEDAGPTSLVNINGQPIVLANAYINEAGHLNLETLKVDKFGQFIMRQEPVGMADGSVEYQDVFDTRLIDAGLVKGKDGVDGTVYERVDVTDRGLITFTTTEGVQHPAGFLIDRSIENARIDEDGVLVLILSDEEEIRTSNVLGKDGMDGKNISDASIDEDGMLWLHFEDDDIPDIPAGIVSFPVEISIEKNNQDEVIFTMANGEKYNAGVLPGVKSKYITEIENRLDGVHVRYSDNPGLWVRIGTVSYVPQSLTIEERRLKLTFTDGSSVMTPEEVLGLDGDTITRVAMEGKNLVVYRTDNNRTSVVRDVFPDIKGASLTDAVYNSSDNTITFFADDGSKNTIPMPQLNDGVGVSDIYRNETSLIFEMSDGVTYTIEDMIGEGVRIVSYNEEESKLVFENTITKEQYFIDAIEGSDGNSITDVTLDGEDLIITFSAMEEMRVPLPRGNIHHRTVEDVELKGDHGIYELHISFTEEDKETIVVPIPKPREGDNIDNVYIDGDNALVFELSSQEEPIVFPTIKGKDGIDITDITYENNDITFHLLDGDTRTVSVPVPTDGISVTDITYTDGVITIYRSNGSELTFDVPYGIDGISIDDITHEGDKIAFHLNNDRTVLIDTPIGADGRTVTGITYEDNLLKVYVDGAIETEIPFRTGNDGSSITDVYVDDRDLIIETDIPEGNGTKTVTFEMIRGKDATDGVSVSRIYTNDGKNLNFKMDNDQIITLPNGALRITDVALDTDNKLKFTYSDGTTKLSSSQVKGRDGVGTGISDIRIDGEILKIEISDATGVVDNINSDLSGFTLDTININSSGELVLRYLDGTTKNLGRVEAEKSNWLKSATVTPDDMLSITITDGETDVVENLGNVKGSMGAHPIDITIDRKYGDMEVTFDDGLVKSVGNIKDDRTLSTWDVNKVPYEKDVVVIHNGRMFLSTEETISQPPSVSWREVAFNDNIIEVLAPYPVKPFNDNVSTAQPTLHGSNYMAASVERAYREFEVTDINDEVIYSVTRNSNSVSIPLSVPLEENVWYKWRIRDVSVNDYVSDWSEYTTFRVRGSLLTPIVTVGGNLSAMPLTTIMTLSNTLSSIGETVDVISSHWEIIDENDNVVFEATLNEDVLTLVVPLGHLELNSSYAARVSYTSQVDTSHWSDTVSFTTLETETPYLRTPVIRYDGNPEEVNISKPLFISTVMSKNEDFTSSGFLTYPVSHISSDWEIVDPQSGDVVLASVEDAKNRKEFCANLNFVIGREYRIRIRHNTDTLGSSGWSEWLPFIVQSSIDTPILTTSENIASFPADGIITVSEYTGTNVGSITKTEIEIINMNSGEPITEMMSQDVAISRDVKVFVPEWMDINEVAVRARHHSVNMTSEWSDPLVLTLKPNTFSPYHVHVFGTVNSSEIHVRTSDGTLIKSIDLGFKNEFESAPITRISDGRFLVFTRNLNNSSNSVYLYDVKQDTIVLLNTLVSYGTVNYAYKRIINAVSRIVENTDDGIIMSYNSINNTIRTLNYNTSSNGTILPDSGFPGGVIRYIDDDLNFYRSYASGTLHKLKKYNLSGAVLDEWDLIYDEDVIDSSLNMVGMTVFNGNMYVYACLQSKVVVSRISTLGVVTHQEEFVYDSILGSEFGSAGAHKPHTTTTSIYATNGIRMVGNKVLIHLSHPIKSSSKGSTFILLDAFLQNAVFNSHVNATFVSINGMSAQGNIGLAIFDNVSYVDGDKVVVPMGGLMTSDVVDGMYFGELRLDLTTLDYTQHEITRNIPLGEGGINFRNWIQTTYNAFKGN